MIKELRKIANEILAATIPDKENLMMYSNAGVELQKIVDSSSTLKLYEAITKLRQFMFHDGKESEIKQFNMNRDALFKVIAEE